MSDSWGMVAREWPWHSFAMCFKGDHERAAFSGYKPLEITLTRTLRNRESQVWPELLVCIQKGKRGFLFWRHFWNRLERRRNRFFLYAWNASMPEAESVLSCAGDWGPDAAPSWIEGLRLQLSLAGGFDGMFWESRAEVLWHPVL